MPEASVNRRSFLKLSLATTAALGVPSLSRASVPFRDLDATAMAQAVRSGEVDPKALVAASRAAIEAVNPTLNAVITKFYDHAMELAARVDRSRPLAGAPYLIKDLSEYEGFRTTFGARLFEANISGSTTPPVAAAVRSGLIPLGKTNTPEYGLLPTTEPLAYGATRNPWNLEYSAGGSSGGSGAAVAAGMVPLALSSDGGGSIRIPSCNCGVFGLKVSRGRNVGAESGPLAFSVRGAISRSVRDSAAHLLATQQTGSGATLPPVVHVTGPSKKRLRIGLVMKGVARSEPSAEVRDAILASAKLCQELDHELIEARFPDSVYDMGDAMMDVSSDRLAQLGQQLEKMLGRPLDERDLEPWTLQQIAYRKSVPDDRFQKAVAHLKHQAAETRAMFEQFDVLLMPVLATRAVKLGYLQSSAEISFDEMLQRNKGYVSYTTVFNISGNPAMSVPLFWTDDGLPIGSHFAAGMGREGTLLALAYELEQARPWKDRHPPASIWGAA